MRTDADLCRCGHQRLAHEHFRDGSDCSLCPAGGCRHFRREHLLRAVLVGLAARPGPGSSDRRR